jgi:hypothetical protein
MAQLHFGKQFDSISAHPEHSSWEARAVRQWEPARSRTSIYLSFDIQQSIVIDP